MMTNNIAANITDIELVNLLKLDSRQSENKVLRHLYDQYFGMIERHVLKNSGREEDVKEVFHDSLMALLNNVRKQEFVLSASLKTYLFSISKRIWLSRLRKINAKEIPMMDDLSWEANELNIQDKIELDEGQLILHDILSKLAGECLQLLRMFYFLKKKMSEIAEITGLVNEKEAKNRKWRCMVKLRKIVSEQPSYNQYLKEYLNDLKST